MKKQTSSVLSPFQRKLLQNQLQQPLPKILRQRIEIMLLADEGKTLKIICQTLGCAPSTANRWMLYAQVQMAHQWQQAPLGRPKKITDDYKQRLEELLYTNPRDLGYPFRRWTAQWLVKHLAKEFEITISTRQLYRILKEKNLSIRTPKNPPQNISSSNLRISIPNLNAQSKSETDQFLPPISSLWQGY
jgi:transposase